MFQFKDVSPYHGREESGWCISYRHNMWKDKPKYSSIVIRLTRLLLTTLISMADRCSCQYGFAHWLFKNAYGPEFWYGFLQWLNFSITFIELNLLTVPQYWMLVSRSYLSFSRFQGRWWLKSAINLLWSRSFFINVWRLRWSLKSFKYFCDSFQTVMD